MRSKTLLIQLVLVVGCSIFFFDILVGITFAEWTPDPTVNIPICTATDDQWNSELVSDGADGAIIIWCDKRSGNDDIYAQRINANGKVLWTTDGVLICTVAGDRYNPELVSDGAGGAIITWYDYRSGSSDIYARRSHCDSHTM